MDDTQPVIVVSDLHKSYGPLRAVDGVSFEVREGEVFGLLGPNGAGKTTTIETLEGLNTPDSGMVSVLGLDPSRGGRALKERIGVQLQTAALCPTHRGRADRSLRQLLRSFAPHPGAGS